MPELVGVIDTGVLCCWLEVPGKETAGSGSQMWNHHRAATAIDNIINRSGTLILPISVVIETANHIAQAPHSRKPKAEQLLNRVIASLEGTYPWKSFDETQRLWTKQWHEKAQQEWPGYAARKMGLADYSIADIAHYFCKHGLEVFTLTTDAALAAEVGHLMPQPISRRRRMN